MNTDKKISRREALKLSHLPAYSRWHPAKQKGVSVSSFILPERVTVFTSPVSWLERTQNC